MSLENLLASLGHLNFLVNGRISLKIYIKFCFENFYWDYTESTDHLGDSEYLKNNKSLINLKNNKSQSISVYLFLFSLSNFFQWCRIIFNIQFVYYFLKLSLKILIFLILLHTIFKLSIPHLWSVSIKKQNWFLYIDRVSCNLSKLIQYFYQLFNGFIRVLHLDDHILSCPKKDI